MARLQAAKITLTEQQERILQQLQTGTHTPMHLKIRAKIILLASQCNTNNDIEKQMGIHGETVTKWRNRYAQAETELAIVESETPRKLRNNIEKTLSDEQRSGKPPSFSDEVAACVIAISCQKPEESGLPFSHWTQSLLRNEVIKRGIVESISATQISRFLKRESFKTASS